MQATQACRSAAAPVPARCATLQQRPCVTGLLTLPRLTRWSVSQDHAIPARGCAWQPRTLACGANLLRRQFETAHRRAAGAAAAAAGVQAAGGAARAVGQGRHARGRCFRPPGVGAALGCALCLGVLPCSPNPVWLAMCTAWMHDMCGGPCRWLPCCQTTSSQAHGHGACASEWGNRDNSLLATQLSHQLDIYRISVVIILPQGHARRGRAPSRSSRASSASACCPRGARPAARPCSSG